jgi:hypothetical protein
MGTLSKGSNSPNRKPSNFALIPTRMVNTTGLTFSETTPVVGVKITASVPAED